MSDRRGPRLEIRTLNAKHGKIEVLPVIIRGRWLQDDRYGDLRNAAWLVRNARWAGVGEGEAVARLTLEAIILCEQGEPLQSLIPSLVDLFMRP